MPRKYDVAIVGAGSTGSTIAYYLAKEGFKVLIVDERGSPGHDGLFAGARQELLHE